MGVSRSACLIIAFSTQRPILMPEAALPICFCYLSLVGVSNYFGATVRVKQSLSYNS